MLTATLDLAQQFVGPLMREGELDELERVARDPARLVEIGSIALRLLEPFRSFVEGPSMSHEANLARLAEIAALSAHGQPEGGSQLLLGHTKIESTVRYLGIEVDDTLAIAEQIDV